MEDGGIYTTSSNWDLVRQKPVGEQWLARLQLGVCYLHIRDPLLKLLWPAVWAPWWGRSSEVGDEFSALLPI